MLRVFDCLLHSHDLRLVALAGCICIMSCYTALSLLARTQDRGARRSWGWLGAAACVFGAGVWSLHFVAMLAYMPDVPMGFDALPTLGSAVLAIVGTGIALGVWRRIASPAIGGLGGGVLLGLAASVMHYGGMAAMRAAGPVSFDATLVAASILIGAMFGAVALYRARRLAGFARRAEVVLWLSLCICGVHFTGMAALHVQIDAMHHGQGMAGAGSTSLAFAVGGVSLAILCVSLAATMMEQRLSQRTVLELQRMRLLSDLSQEVMLIQRNGVVLEANAAGGRLFGIRTGDLIGCTLLDLFASDDQAAVARRLDAGAAQATEEVCVRTGNGRMVPVEISSSPTDYGGRPAVAVALRDLSDRRRNEARIRHLAHHDQLTDLPNRFLLAERLSRALDMGAESGTGVALLYLDLDRFKPVNDLLGHAGGDALLVQVAARLRAELRSTDTLARVGGDEFVIATPVGQTPQNAGLLAARLLDTLNRPFDIMGNEVAIGASIGVALYPTDADGQEALIRAADTALYRVKAEGRGSFRLYQPDMDDHVQERLRLEQDLRHAVDRGQLELHYQPVLQCGSGRTEGFEALVRWRHPERGLVPPLEFIPLAEETVQIWKIGEWVIEAACVAAMGWAEPYWVAVNVSPLQFRQADFTSRIAAILARTGLAATRLEIEVTESVFIDDKGRAMTVLAELRGLGVRISLDDFGTGYSSLSYLCSFAFDKIKIDRSFIKGLGQSAEADMIVRTIINLGHNLGLSITAEGIETPQQLSLIEGGGCDQVQGYLLGRPSPQLPVAAPARITTRVAADGTLSLIH